MRCCLRRSDERRTRRLLQRTRYRSRCRVFIPSFYIFAFCIFHFASSILHLSRRVTVALASIAHRLRVDHRSLSQIHHARIETFYAARFFAGHEIAARLVGAGCPVRVRSSRRTQKPTTRERLNGIARVAAQKIPKPREFPVVACGKYRRACISPPFWRADESA